MEQLVRPNEVILLFARNVCAEIIDNIPGTSLDDTL